VSIEHLRRAWDTLGRKDPLWAVLSQPDKRHNRWDTREFFRTGEEEIAALFEDLDGRGLAVNRGRGLDFGCGVGRLAQALCGYFDQVDGIDIAESMVDRAQQLNRHGVRCRYHLNVRPDLRLFADAIFDFVYSNIVLQHMAPELAERYIAEFMRVLTPGGMSVFQVPSRYVGIRPFGPDGRAEPRLVALSGVRRFRACHPRNLARRGCDALRLVKRRSGPFEMHPVPRERVVDIVESAGGDVLAIEDYPVSGPEWENYRYIVRRPVGPADVGEVTEASRPGEDGAGAG
jgi:SAM-dependent methyltransferase